MRVAVLGGGAAGMGAAWGLAKNGHAVTLIEREPQLGGHLLACAVPTADGGTVNVDVGVSDFNRNTFTNVGALFDELGLEHYPINQHASFMHPDGRTAWFTNDVGVNPVTPFADQGRFTGELARFKLECIEVLDDPAARDETLNDYCDRRDYSQEFRTRYLYPRAQGSFPMPDQDPATYPVRGLVAFWHIHGLAGRRPANRNVLKGGMASYGEAFAKWLAAHGRTVITDAPVVGVARRGEGVRVRWETGDTAGGSREEIFDHCVFAVRGEQVLPLLEDPSREESEVFGSLRWHRARVAVHRDTRLMPDRREAWGAYNYVLNEDGAPEIRPTITFYPAKLAGLQGVDDVFVTMNPFRDLDPNLTIANYFLSHPAAGTGGDMAAARIAQIQGTFAMRGSPLVLAHNGDLAQFARMRFALLEYIRPAIAERIVSNIDSAWLHALVLSHFDDPAGPFTVDEIHGAVESALAIVRKLREREGIDASSSVNLIVGDGRNIVATRFTYDFGKFEKPPFQGGVDYLSMWYTLGARYGFSDGEWKMTGGDGPATLVASEPLTRDVSTWLEVPEYSMLLVDGDGGRRIVPVDV